nr:type IV pili methyl-accepting chemotaxis transducer N-terminal domain-containing protein [uncultured Desulfobacter sp.]
MRIPQSIPTKIIMVVFYLICCVMQAAASNVITPGEWGTIINLSGRQRMLSQKMSKEILLISLDYNKAENLSALEKTANLFDTTLKRLRDGDPELSLPPTFSRRILRQIDLKITPVWKAFFHQVQEIIRAKTVSSDQLNTVIENNIPLLSEMNKCVKLYEKEASKSGVEMNPKLAVTINLAGKQRMLSQKMSKEFFIIAKRSNHQADQLSLQETYTLFDRTLKGLMDGDTMLELPGTKDQAIRAQLGKVQSLWQDFKPLMEYGAKSKNAISAEKIESVAQKNLPLLAEMNKAVKMYETQASK